MCTREVAHWKRLLEASSDTKNELVLQDISGVGGVGSALGAFGVSLEEAMARAHVIDATGTLHTGFPAFTHVWATLPYWKHLAWVLQTVPLAMSVAEVAYGVWSGARRHLQPAGSELTVRASPGASCRYVPGQKGPPPDCAA